MSPYKQRYSPTAGHKNGTVYEHVLIAQTALGGRSLPNGAEVHHVDGNQRNNTRRNLVICQSKAYHKLLHVRARVLAAGGDPNTSKICGKCGRVKPLSDFSLQRASRSTGRQNRCVTCARQAWAEYSARRQSA